METKYLRLRTPVEVGSWFDDWQVCWLGGWGKHRLYFLAQPSQLMPISHLIRADRRGKPFAVSETFSQGLVVETYPLCRQAGFWHSATENVSAQQYPDQGRKGTPLLHGGGKAASAMGER